MNEDELDLLPGELPPAGACRICKHRPAEKRGLCHECDVALHPERGVEA